MTLALRRRGRNRAVHESIVLAKADTRLELLIQRQEIHKALSKAGIHVGREQSCIQIGEASWNTLGTSEAAG